MSHLGPVLTGTAVVQVGRAGWQRQRWSHFAESSGLRVRWPMSIPVSMASSKLITTQGDSTYSESSVRCQLTVCLLSLGYREGTVHQRKDNPERASTNPLPPCSSTVCLWTSPGKGELGTAWWVDAPPSWGPPLWAGWRGPRTRNEGWLDTTLPFWRPPDPSVLPMVCLYYLDHPEDLSTLLPKVFRWELLNQKERERERGGEWIQVTGYVSVLPPDSFNHSLAKPPQWRAAGALPPVVAPWTTVSQILLLLQFSSVTQSCPTLCDPMNRSTPGLPVHHQLPEFTQTHVHWVGDAIQPSHPLSSPSPPALNLSQHQSLFKWVSSSHQVAKVLEFQIQHQSFQWTPRTDFL